METTIKIEELRIGNLVYSQYENDKVHKIRGCDISALEEGMDPYSFKPIPLSIDLLKDWYGFQKWTSENNIFISGMFIWLCQGMFICNKNGVIIKSVHQLQNLFYATNNKEIKFIGSLNTEG